MEPKIRFKGFDGEWKTSTIGDFTTSFSGGTPTAGASEFYGGNIPFIRSGEIHESKTELFLTEAGLNNSSAKVVEKGTLLYALYGATSGEVGISKIKGAINQAILAIYPNKTVDKRFLANYLQSHKQKIVGELLQGGQGNLSGALVKSISVTYPNNREQQTISDYVDSLDSQIFASTSRLASLKQMKAASLQAMFPQEGETVPKIRFKGFEGEWKKVKLSEILTERHENSTITDSLPQLSFTIADGVIRPEDRKSNKRDFLIKDIDNKRYLVTKVGDIIYNPANVVYGAIHRNSLMNGVVSPIYKIFTTMQDSNFIECAVRRPSFITKLAMCTEGTVTKLKTLKPEAFLNMEVCITPSLEEQKLIGNYFTSLDRQISLQSQSLEKLKQIKSACLDKMFV
mgnify:CR=1 FL=1|jgi:type I restriction enzyme S subunit